jgi:L-ascorbate metabolism protein UlaG (beta-lactamase superfamily)
MRIRWYGQSAFTLTGDEHTVTIDPFGAPRPGLPVHFGYPAIAEHPADLLLITHEHFDHNGAEVVTGSPEVVRTTAGVFPTRIGDVTAIASEHDDAAGTKRGPNTIFVFELDGRRVCHFGDFGQQALRPEQRTAIGAVDLLMVPVGGDGATIAAAEAMAIVAAVGARLVVPMHYRTERIGFLEPLDATLAGFERVHRAETPTVDAGALGASADGPTLVVPAVP